MPQQQWHGLHGRIEWAGVVVVVEDFGMFVSEVLGQVLVPIR
jgi:hypothetical protein